MHDAATHASATIEILPVAVQLVLAQGKLSPTSLSLFEQCGHHSVEAQIKAS